MNEVLALISKKFKTMSEVPNWGSSISQSHAITAFFPYAVQQAQNGQHEMLDAFFHTIRVLGEPWFMWWHIRPFVTMLLEEESPVSKKQAMILASPHLPWWKFQDTHLVPLWAAAASEVPYTDEICQSVVDTLLHIASSGNLQPHIPDGMWLWLNKCPTLPLVCTGRARGSIPGVFQVVHGLGDAEILKSYLLLVWSEWNCLHSGWMQFMNLPDCLCSEPMKCLSHEGASLEMRTSIREAFSGVGADHYKGGLLQRLDHILGQLDLGLGHLQQHKPSLNEDDVQLMKKQYAQLKEVLLEVGQEE